LERRVEGEAMSDETVDETADRTGDALQLLSSEAAGVFARVRAVLTGVRAERQQTAIRHEQAAAGHAARGDAATARLEDRMAAQHRQRLAEVEAALAALDALVRVVLDPDLEMLEMGVNP